MAESNLDILFQDADILAINKPSGLLTIPDGFQPNLPHVRALLEPTWGRLWIVHRLDKGTSGVLLLARNPETHRQLNDQFTRHSIQKEYHAIVVGSPVKDQWDVTFPLKVNGDRDHRTVIDTISGKPASAHFTTLQRFAGGYSLLAVQPHTGYTHQIRAHLAACGLPILGDTLYKSKPQDEFVKMLGIVPPSRVVTAIRLGLHAYRLQFAHPANNEVNTVTAPYPPDFSALLNHLLLNEQRAGS